MTKIYSIDNINEKYDRNTYYVDNILYSVERLPQLYHKTVLENNNIIVNAYTVSDF